MLNIDSYVRAQCTRSDRDKELTLTIEEDCFIFLHTFPQIMRFLTFPSPNPTTKRKKTAFIADLFEASLPCQIYNCS